MKKLLASTAFIALLAAGLPGMAHAQMTDTQSTSDLNKAEMNRINGMPSDEQPGTDGGQHGEWKHEHGGHCMHHHHHCGHHHHHHGHHHHWHHHHHDQDQSQAPGDNGIMPAEQPAQ